MTKNVPSSTLSRRGFLAAQGGLLAVGAAPLANASTQKTWPRVTQQDLSPLCGETFTAKFADGSRHRLKLVEAEKSRSGWRRPLHLKRAEGVTLSFKASDAAIEKFSEQDGDILQISHSSLGKTEAFFTAVPLKSGKVRLEAVFN